MSKFVDDDWSAYRPVEELGPPVRTVATWLRTEHLANASEQERFEHWIEWNKDHTAAPELLASITRSGRSTWVEAVRQVASGKQQA